MSVDIKIGEANASKIRFKVQHNQLASLKAGQARSVARVYANNRYNLQDLAGLLTQRGCLAKKTEVKYVLDSACLGRMRLVRVEPVGSCADADVEWDTEINRMSHFVAHNLGQDFDFFTRHVKHQFVVNL